MGSQSSTLRIIGFNLGIPSVRSLGTTRPKVPKCMEENQEACSCKESSLTRIVIRASEIIPSSCVFAPVRTMFNVMRLWKSPWLSRR